EVESKGICKGTHKLTYGTWQERQEAEIEKVEELQTLCGVLLAMLAMFFNYSLKLDARTIKLEKKNGKEQKQINELKTKHSSERKEETMNKANLQKELLAKIKPGTKPSDLKKTRTKAKPKEVLPPPIQDEGYGSDNAPLKPSKQPTSTIPPIVPHTIPTPSPAPNIQLLALKKQIELHKEIKKADEQKKQELAEQVKKLEGKIQTLIKLAGEEKAEYEKTIETLKKPTKNQAEIKPKETKIFLCSDCQQTKPQNELSRQFGKFSFCLACSKKARVQAQQEKTKPQPSDFICHTCQQTKTEIPNKMKLDFTLQVYLICSLCRPNLKEFNEADLITDDLWAKYPYSSAAEILAKEFGIKKEELCPTTEEIRKTLASGGYGLVTIPIVKHFFDRYQYRTFEPYEDDFIAQFKTNCMTVVVEQYLKKLTLKTDTRTGQNYDKTQIQGAFANVDLTSGNYGGFSRQQQLSTQSQEQGQGSRTSNRNSTTAKQNHSNKEYMRANKDANVSTITQDSYALADILKSRLLGNFEFTIIKLSDYYPLFNKLFIKMFGCSVVPVIDPETGRRRWVSQVDLPYLERLKILKGKTEKEHKKLPDTSNRKPRISKRLEVIEGCVEAYEPEYIELPTPEVFLQRIRGEVEGYTRVIGYQNIIEIVEKYLKSYHFAKRYSTPPPAQLMIMLLGEPGLGKTYISQAIARALGRGFHLVGMNGKKVASFITGTGIENPGADPGEVLKAIYKRKDRGAVICFDEIEKADRECKEACGIPTDITTNKGFTDTFLDFPTPTNECIFVATVNRTEDVPPFIADRFAIRIEVLPLPYRERLEVIRVILQTKNNILLKLIPTLTSDFLVSGRALPADLREGVDDKCPYARDKRNEHKVNCMCFVRNLDMVSGWVEEMGEISPELNGSIKFIAKNISFYLCPRLLWIGKNTEPKVEFRQVEAFKDLLRQLNTQPMFLTDREDELFASDSEKMLEGTIKEQNQDGITVATQNRKG
ncbi:5892_t:CDS:10, partial [Funneliformis geosporum]